MLYSNFPLASYFIQGNVFILTLLSQSTFLPEKNRVSFGFNSRPVFNLPQMLLTSLLLSSGLRATANYYGACKFIITVFLLSMDNFNKEEVKDIQRRHQQSICNYTAHKQD